LIRFLIMIIDKKKYLRIRKIEFKNLHHRHRHRHQIHPNLRHYHLLHHHRLHHRHHHHLRCHHGLPNPLLNHLLPLQMASFSYLYYSVKSPNSRFLKEDIKSNFLNITILKYIPQRNIRSELKRLFKSLLTTIFMIYDLISY